MPGVVEKRTISESAERERLPYVVGLRVAYNHCGLVIVVLMPMTCERVP